MSHDPWRLPKKSACGGCCGGPPATPTNRAAAGAAADAASEQQPEQRTPTEIAFDAANFLEVPIYEDDSHVDTIRREVSSMTTEETNRFMKAVKRMMQNRQDPETGDEIDGTSIYYEIAKLHGEPDNFFCAHGKESFPIWHSVYLRAFELALQRADKLNGNDGKVFLPYWDWTDETVYTESHMLPKVIRQNFTEIPMNLFPKEVQESHELPRIVRRSDKSIHRDVLKYDVKRDALDSLLNDEHWSFSCTGFEPVSIYASVEKSHNMVHGIAGFPMSHVGWASFDLLFWLHHAQIDRIQSTYNQLEEDCIVEFNSFQATQEVDLSKKPLEPFVDQSDRLIMPQNAFSTKNMGFVYDEIQKTSDLKPYLETYVKFENIKVVDLENKNYAAHVFVLPPSRIASFRFPLNEDEFADDPSYAGADSTFGRDKRCPNCVSRPDITLSVRITKTLERQELNRWNAIIKVVLVEVSDPNRIIRSLSSVPAISRPVIRGPTLGSTEFKGVETSMYGHEERQKTMAEGSQPVYGGEIAPLSKDQVPTKSLPPQQEPIPVQVAMAKAEAEIVTAAAAPENSPQLVAVEPMQADAEVVLGHSASHSHGTTTTNTHGTSSTGTSFMSELIDEFEDLAEEIQEKVSDIGSDIGSAARKANEAMANAAQEVRDAAADLASNIGSAAKDAGEAVNDRLSSVKSDLESIASNVQDKISDVQSQLASIASDVGSNIGDAANHVHSELKDAGSLVNSLASDAASDIRSATKKIGEHFDEFGNKIEDAASNIASDIGSAARQAGEGIENVADLIGDHLSSIKSDIDSATKDVRENLDELKSDVSSHLSSLHSDVKSLADSVRSDFADIAEKLDEFGNKIENLIEFVTNEIEDAFDTIGVAYNQFGDLLEEGTRNALGQLISFTGSVVDFWTMAVREEQWMLKRIGLYAGEIDGIFGEATEAAIRAFQRMMNLVEDGISGILTKSAMLKLRCHNLDPYNHLNDISDTLVNPGTLDEYRGKISFTDGDGKVSWYLKNYPGYLVPYEGELIKLIQSSFEEWAREIHLDHRIHFDRCMSEESAEVVIQFQAFRDSIEWMYDGVPGTLGEAGKGFIHFDIVGKRWIMPSQEANPDLLASQRQKWTQTRVPFQPALMHMIGHVFGFDHRSDFHSIMNPVFDENKRHLSAEDVDLYRQDATMERQPVYTNDHSDSRPSANADREEPPAQYHDPSSSHSGSNPDTPRYASSGSRHRSSPRYVGDGSPGARSSQRRSSATVPNYSGSKQSHNSQEGGY